MVHKQRGSMNSELLHQVLELRDRGAIFFINHSGGKDSQCMFLEMGHIIPFNQLVVIHAHLPEVEWKGTIDHIKNTTKGGIKFIQVQAVKTFFEMVEHRQMFPSPGNRQCTSDLKRGPIEKAIRHYLKKAGKKLIVNCMGLRAEESPNRAKKETFKFNKKNSKAGREWYDLLPIHERKVSEVFETIERHGQEPHWAYSVGMTRLSCCFCIMASDHDLKVAAEYNKDLYNRFVETEKRLNFTMSMSRKPLTEITGIKIEKDFYIFLREQFNDLPSAKLFAKKFVKENQRVSHFGSFTCRAMAYHISEALEGKFCEDDDDSIFTSYIETKYGSEIVNVMWSES